VSSVVDRMSALERAARRAWLEKAVDQKSGVCPDCGRFARLARQIGRRVYECLDCWDARA
jgi:hypothetical protein